MKNISNFAVRVSMFGLALCLLAATSQASIEIVDLNLYSTGSRATVGAISPGGGLVWNPPAGDWSGGNFSLSWDIMKNANDFTYEYTVNTPSGGSAQLSHWILALSQVDADGNSLQSHWDSIFAQGNGYTDTGIGAIPSGEIKVHGSGGNPGKPGDLYGVKFTRDTSVTETIVTFTTPQVPIWGDFYAKDGGGTGSSAVYAYNTGFGTMPNNNSNDGFLGWIPRPDGVVTPPPPPPPPPLGDVPESTALAVWSILAMCGACGTRRLQRD